MAARAAEARRRGPAEPGAGPAEPAAAENDGVDPPLNDDEPPTLKSPCPQPSFDRSRNIGGGSPAPVAVVDVWRGRDV